MGFKELITDSVTEIFTYRTTKLVKTNDKFLVTLHFTFMSLIGTFALVSIPLSAPLGGGGPFGMPVSMRDLATVLGRVPGSFAVGFARGRSFPFLTTALWTEGHRTSRSPVCASRRSQI